MDYRLDDLLHVISNIVRNLEAACFDVLMHFCFHLSYDFLGQVDVTGKRCLEMFADTPENAKAAAALAAKTAKAGELTSAKAHQASVAAAQATLVGNAK